MRRNIGLVLAGLGAFLIVLAVVLPTWIVGQVVKFPLNEFQTATLAADPPGHRGGGSAGAVLVERGTSGHRGAVSLAGQDLRR